MSVADEEAVAALARVADSRHVLVVAGSAGKSGAAVLAGTGALKAGAGLVTILTPSPVQAIVAAGELNELVKRGLELGITEDELTAAFARVRRLCEELGMDSRG